MVKREVSIDSSALSRVLNDPSLVGSLVTFVEVEDARLVVPFAVQQETIAYDPGSPEGNRSINDRLKALRTLWRNLDCRLAFGDRLGNILRQEVARPIVRTPTITSRNRKGLLEIVFNDAIVDKASRFEAQLYLASSKAKFAEQDERFAAAVEESRGKYPSAELHRLMTEFKGPDENQTWFENIERWMPGFKGKDAVQNPSRYRCAYTLAAFSIYYAYGIGLEGTYRMATNDPVVQKTKPKVGDHHDYMIAAASAYCDLILMKDKGFFKRNNELFDRGITKTKAVLLDEI